MSEHTPDLDHLELRPLPGSDRPADDQPGISFEPLDPTARIQVTLVVRRKAELPEASGADPMTPAELAASYGADPADIDLVTSTLTSLGVQIVDIDRGARLIRVAATVDVLDKVFGSSLQRATSTDPGRLPPGNRRRSGGLSVPAALDGVVTAVLGLDDRPQARALFHTAAPGSVSTSYTPPQLGHAYDFPPNTDGSGQTIAIIELGGGFDQADLDTYFAALGITTPTITAVGVDGAANHPGQDPQGADGEVLLDIEVAGALAPGAAIVVYFAPNTDAGFLDAVSQAAHADPTPTGISISWGQSEDSWTGQGRAALDQALADAAALGVVVAAAAGDGGSADRATDGKVHVDFPASSPHALACGGTHLEADASSGAVTSETVWNNGSGQGATGGGVSDVFALPPWQRTVGVPASTPTSGGGPPVGSGGPLAPESSPPPTPAPPATAGGRGVPDVAADADPKTGYQVRIDGQDTVIGGTSAVSPLWSALVARLAQATGRKLGPLQPALYAAASAGQVAPGFRDITQGDNGAYSAGPGWDPCTGLGVPDGVQLLQALRQATGTSG